jgi:hypothetical protein
MDSIREVEEQREKALRKKVGLEYVDEYVENDKALRNIPSVEIVDAEIID